MGKNVLSHNFVKISSSVMSPKVKTKLYVSSSMDISLSSCSNKFTYLSLLSKSPLESRFIGKDSVFSFFFGNFQYAFAMSFSNSCFSGELVSTWQLHLFLLTSDFPVEVLKQGQINVSRLLLGCSVSKRVFIKIAF